MRLAGDRGNIRTSGNVTAIIFMLIFSTALPGIYTAQAQIVVKSEAVSQNFKQPLGTVIQAGVPKLLDFEDLSIGTVVFNQYKGVVFVGGDDVFHPITINRTMMTTVSPTHVIQRSFNKFLCGSCHLVQDLRFDVPQYRVAVSTGLAGDIMPIDRYTLLLQGWTGFPHSQGSVLLSQSTASCLGKGSTPIATPLEIHDNKARIQYAELAVVRCDNVTMSPSSGTILLDNLLYDRPLNPPIRENDPPIFTAISPTNGSTIRASTPGLPPSISVRANLTETALANVTAEVNGLKPVLVTFYQTDPNNYKASVLLDDKAGLINGTNNVVLTAWDLDRPAHKSTINSSFTYFTRSTAPLLAPSPNDPPQDFWPTAFEVTQSIDNGPQTFALTDYVCAASTPTPDSCRFRADVPPTPPLLQGKPTLIRIYGAVTDTTTPQPFVPAAMEVTRDTPNCPAAGENICVLARSLPPTTAMTGGPLSLNIAGITVAPVGTADGLPRTAASNLAKTWDFVIPPTWTGRDLKVIVKINYGNYILGTHSGAAMPVAPECVSSQLERCQNNNTVELHLHFQTPAQITVNPVFIHLTGTFNGRTFNDVTPTNSQFNTMFSLLNEQYPLNVVRGFRSDITENPGISGYDLAEEINDLAISRPDLFFLGIFPGDQGAFAANQPNTAGGAFVGDLGAWANAVTTLTAAHELGHNIGFDHWGCADGSTTTDECRVYPSANGHAVLGVFGTDISNWRVIAPGDVTGIGPHAHDMMVPAGETPSNWISWYDYNIILNHHSVDSYDTEDPLALIVSGDIGPTATGNVTFHPVYQINVTRPISDNIGVEDGASEIYTIQGYDSKGNTLLVHNFEPHKLDRHFLTLPNVYHFDEAVPSMPNLQRLAVLKGPQILGNLTNPSPGSMPTVRIVEPMKGSVWSIGSPQTIRWVANDSHVKLPLYALVQYSSDGGKTRLPLGDDINGTSLTINSNQLPGSANTMIYVEVSDGMNTAMAQTGPLTVAAKPPTVHIIAPKTNSTAVALLPVTLEGTASDPQESLSDKQYVWSSNLDGIIGIGQLVTPLNMTIGRHIITLTVIDSHGLAGRDTIQLNVRPITKK